MASTILGNHVLSGPQFLFSGNPYSGMGLISLIGMCQLRWDKTASGNCYLYSQQDLSGSMTLRSGGTPTISSGGMFLSGGGLGDGMILYPGDAYSVPVKYDGVSGQVQIGALCDQAASGQGRLWYNFY